VIILDGTELRGKFIHIVGSPEEGDPREQLPDIRGEVETQLVEQQDECLCLESLIKCPTPRYKRDRLFGEVVVERYRFMWDIRARQDDGSREDFHSAGIQ
jgi:hypothetical protein